MASPAIGTGTGNIQTNSSIGATSLAINAPTNAANGDLLVMAFSTASDKTLTATGWTSIASVLGTIMTAEATMFWRTHDGSSSYTVSWSGSVACAGTIVLVTGADTSSPVDVSATFDRGASASSVSQTTPSVTTTVADTLLLGQVVNQSAGAFTTASSQTEISDVGITGLAQHFWKLAVAGTGATGTKTSTSDVSSRWVSIAVAVKPVPSLIKSIGSVPIASVKKVSGVAIASAKKVAGVANT